ncbi:Hint domain-containing protein [Patescibacteria group bacterium]
MKKFVLVPTIVIFVLMLVFTGNTKAQCASDPPAAECCCNCWWAACHPEFNPNCCLGDIIFISFWIYTDSDCSGAPCGSGACSNCSGDCSTSCSGCFAGETSVDTPVGQKEIKDLQVEDEVSSFDPVTGQEVTSLVDKIYEVTRSAQYRVKLKNGQKLRVTGEHPLYATQKDQGDVSRVELDFWEYLKTESLIKKAINHFLN